MSDPALASEHFTPPELANFLAARTVAEATAYLDGRHDADRLGRAADAFQGEIMTAWYGEISADINAVLVPVRLLVLAMRRAALAQELARQDRWQQVMGALVELVRHESAELRRSGAQRS